MWPRYKIWWKRSRHTCDDLWLRWASAGVLSLLSLRSHPAHIQTNLTSISFQDLSCWTRGCGTMHRLCLTFSAKVMSACSSPFRDIINIFSRNISLCSFMFVFLRALLFIRKLRSKPEGTALTVFMWTRNNLIFYLMRGTEKKQVQTPQSLCLREKHKVEGEYGMLCVRRVQRVHPADAPSVGGLWMLLFQWSWMSTKLFGSELLYRHTEVKWECVSAAFYAKHQIRTRLWIDCQGLQK